MSCGKSAALVREYWGPTGLVLKAWREVASSAMRARVTEGLRIHSSGSHSSHFASDCLQFKKLVLIFSVSPVLWQGVLRISGVGTREIGCQGTHPVFVRICCVTLARHSPFRASLNL